MNYHRLMMIAAGVLIGAGLIVALGRTTGMFEIGSTTLAVSFTLVGVILLVGSLSAKPSGPAGSDRRSSD